MKEREGFMEKFYANSVGHSRRNKLSRECESKIPLHAVYNKKASKSRLTTETGWLLCRAEGRNYVADFSRRQRAAGRSGLVRPAGKCLEGINDLGTRCV
jgi:hypothetical protein